MRIGQNVKDLCMDYNISIKRLAKQVGIQDSLLYKYASNKSIPTVDNLIKLANYFDCSLNYLIGIDDEPKSYKFKETYNKDLFFKRYSQLLQENHLTNHALSKKLDFSPSDLKHWKEGTIPYLETIIKLADYFGVSIDYLVGRED